MYTYLEICVIYTRELYATKETATEPMVPTKIALDHFMQVREISIILLWLLCRRFASEE
jgi:hypothetical protein